MISFWEKIFKKILILHGMRVLLLPVFASKTWTLREMDEIRLEAPHMKLLRSLHSTANGKQNDFR
jgi:hypothetical protein